MFCSNCGNELTEGARFCSRCGNKIDAVVLREKEEMADCEVNSMSEKFANISVQDRFSERVNSELFSDRKSQNKLFSIYVDLVGPVKEIERYTELMHQHEERVKLLKSKEFAKSEGWKFCVVIFIALFIGQWFVKPIEMLFDLFVPSLYDGLVEWIGSLGILWNLLFMTVVMIMGFCTVPLFGLVVYLLVWSLVIGPILQKRTYAKNLAEAEKVQGDIETLSQRREAKCSEVKDLLAYVPKLYRYSEAIEYFVELYNSSRVDNLKEAINTYVHDKQEAEKVEVIRTGVDEVVQYLSYIAEKV